MTSRGLMSFFAIVLFAAVVRGQCERWVIGPDQSTTPGVTGAFLDPGSVYACASWDPDGEGPAPNWLVVGGSFLRAGGVESRGIAAWDGESWRAMQVGTALVVVNALSVYQGELIAAGQFTNIGGVAASNIARWNGQSWAPMATGLPGTVWALEVHQGELYAGGGFSGAGNIARWTGAVWQPVGGGVNGAVYGLETSPLGLVAVGSFNQAGGSTASRIALWNGTTWARFGTGLQGSAHSVVSHPDGSIIVGGLITSAGGVPVNNLTRWDGAGWRAMGSGSSVSVAALVVHEGTLISTGSYRTSGDLAKFQLARWTSHENWVPVGEEISGPSSSATIRSICVHEGRVTVAGRFTQAGETAVLSATAFDGGAWRSFSGGFNGSVVTFATWNGRLCAGGYFSDRVAAWDGLSWEALGPELNGPVAELVEFNGELVAGGTFTMAGETPVNRIAKWNGVEWTPLGGGLPSEVRALAVFRGELFAAIASGPVSRWDGAQWHEMPQIMEYPNGSNVSVFDLCVHDNALIAVGAFMDTGPGWLHGHCCRWDGEEWSVVQLIGAGNRNLPSLVYSVREFRGGLALGGTFAGDAGFTIVNPGEIGPIPWLWGSQSSVAALWADGEARLYAAGGFTMTFQGDEHATVRGAAMWSPDEPLWESPGGGVNYASAIGGFHGEVLFGGALSDVGGVPCFYWARWSPTGVPWVALQPKPAAVSCGEPAEFEVAPATGYGDLTYAWKLEIAQRGWRHLTDGPLAIDGRDVGVISGASGPVLRITLFEDPGGMSVRGRIESECGSEDSEVVGFAVACSACDPDVNCDGVPDQDDVACMILAVAGDMGCFCQADPDFNRDGVPDQGDVADVILTVAGAPCP